MQPLYDVHNWLEAASLEASSSKEPNRRLSLHIRPLVLKVAQAGGEPGVL